VDARDHMIEHAVFFQNAAALMGGSVAMSGMWK
jgi:hypothetical protein